MATLKEIRIKNLRCLSDTEFIPIKPLTILVGKNSAGKSTFARTFALLRQSIEAEKRSPILWFGNYVDFGSFKTAINHSAENQEIEFTFKLPLSKATSEFLTWE